jgi:hypothetical protein
MAKKDDSARRSTAIVAFDCQAQTSLAVEITRHATTMTSFGLLGVLIDEVELLEHARSSFAREVLYSGFDRRLETVELSRQIRARSKQARSEFETAAKKLGLPHEFRSSRGNVLSKLAEWANESETLVATLAADSVAKRTAWDSALRELSTASIRTLLFAREGWRFGSSILVVIDDTKAADATLAIAKNLAEGSHSPLFLGLSKRVTNETAAKLTAALKANLSVPLQIVGALDATGPNAIVAAIKQTHARIAILPWEIAANSPDLINRLLTTTNTAIALVK